MKPGEVIKLSVKKVPEGVDKESLTTAFSKFGTVENISMKGPVAHISLKWNGMDFVDSSGIGELTAPNGKTVLYGLVAPRRD